MKKMLDMFKLLSDESRLRTLMLLQKRELCVCQIMAVLGMSQPLVSRNLSLLVREGFLDARREGKLVFYRRRGNLQRPQRTMIVVLKKLLGCDRRLSQDLRSLRGCEEYQRKTGKCDMKTFKAFIKQSEARRKRSLK